jgi:hypothetical protein
MMTRYVTACLAALLPSLASALNPVTWTLDETINRGQASRFWTSPTAIDLGLQSYSYSYEITRVQATVLSFVTVDVTDQIAQSFDLTGAGTAPALPATLVDAALNDSSTGTTADVHIYVDNNGFGRADFTNIILGTANVGFGAVSINKIRVEATITLSGVLPLPGDYNRDGLVSPADRNVWRLAYGATGTRSGATLWLRGRTPLRFLNRLPRRSSYSPVAADFSNGASASNGAAMRSESNTRTLVHSGLPSSMSLR